MVNAPVTGLNEFKREDWPPLAFTSVPFHIMVGLGMYFIGFSALGLFLLWRKMLFTFRPYLWLALCSIPLPHLAIQLGWMTAEVGRQPWIVYNVLRTSEAISPTVPAVQMLISLILFSLLYLFLFVVWFTAVRRLVFKGPETAATATQEVSA